MAEVRDPVSTTGSPMTGVESAKHEEVNGKQQEAFYALPDAKIPQAAGELKIKDENDHEITFKSLYEGKEGRQLIVFVRHFYCGVSPSYPSRLTILCILTEATCIALRRIHPHPSARASAQRSSLHNPTNELNNHRLRQHHLHPRLPHPHHVFTHKAFLNLLRSQSQDLRQTWHGREDAARR